ncbi:MAG: replicative DNA helicase [Christensenellales bacterium]
MKDQRIPPNNKEAEQSVLGSMLLDASAVSAAAEMLSPDDFHVPAHREIFAAMLSLYQSGKPVDLVTVNEALGKKAVLAGIGGLEYIADLSAFVPSAANAKHYINIVEEKSVLRRLISASSETAKDCYEEESQLEMVLGNAEKRVFDLSMRKHSDSLRHVHDALTQSYVNISEAVNSKGGITGVPTGFIILDKMTSGLHSSELIVIAGRPGMGKTSLAMNIVQNAAVKENIPCAVFSLEMSREQLATRLLCTQGGVDLQKVRTGDLQVNDFKILTEAMQQLGNAPIYIDDTPGLTALEMRSKCRRLKIEHGLGLVMVDYLQLMSGTSRSENRQQEISEITRQMKLMARELQVPIMLLSQLNRASEKRDQQRPILADLRESGAIEQDADIVLFISRQTAPEGSPSEALVIVAKQRNGPVGDIPLIWEGQHTRFKTKDFREEPL